jgi:hypothetical protein
MGMWRRKLLVLSSNRVTISMSEGVAEDTRFFLFKHKLISRITIIFKSRNFKKSGNVSVRCFVNDCASCRPSLLEGVLYFCCFLTGFVSQSRFGRDIFSLLSCDVLASVVVDVCFVVFLY